jgi:hypothetical protein
LDKALGKDPVTSAKPPVLAKGTTSGVAIKIFSFLDKIPLLGKKS